MNDVTHMLKAIEQGDLHAAGSLLPLIYDELRKLAAAKLAHEAKGQTLQATALVHEAYLRLVNSNADEANEERWDGRHHFFGAAAEAMRRILVENARRKQRIKHGGDFERQALDDIEIAAPEPQEDLISLDAALSKLAQVDRSAAELVQLRYFAGITLPEAARLMSISPRSADRLWAYAKAWLHHEMIGTDAS